MAGEDSAPKKENWWSVIPSTITAISAFIAALPALILAIVSLIQAIDAREEAKKAQNRAAAAQVDFQDIPKINQIHPLSVPSSEVSVSAGFVVQLATYAAKNCSSAQSEIDLYGDSFNTRPTLWFVSTANAVVVGIKTNNVEQAQAIQRMANELSKNPKFSNESLDRTRVRSFPPGWKSIRSCSDPL